MLTETLKTIKPLDKNFFDIAQRHLDNLTKPPRSLGRLEEFASRLVAITAKEMPDDLKKAIFTFASDHGVADEAVSAYPKEVTAQMVMNFLQGGAGINVLARHAGADVVVIDIGVDYDFPQDMPIKEGFFERAKVMKGSANMLKQPAMTRDEAIKCIEVGINLANKYADQGYNIFGTGEMGIGNTTPSSAIASVITGLAVKDVTGRGSGIDDKALMHKIAVIEQAIALHKPNPKDAIDVLHKVGGPEIAGIAGLILGASARRIPVVVDGFISTAGALIAYCIEPTTSEYMFASHKSVEIGHAAMLDKMGLKPMFDLNMRLGEGTGSAVAMMIIEGGLKIYKEMATFDTAGVSGKGIGV